jgi:hypothetical protein
MKTFPSIGVQIPRVLLPKEGIDLTKWAVIACDQFTSQPEYWGEVDRIVGDSPSSINLIFPEVYLEEAGADERIHRIQASMQAYLDRDLFVPEEGFIYVERSVDGKTRQGLVLSLDLEQYDYLKGSRSLIRATEGTIVDRLPPRIRIRQGAPLEVPHILVLIDDPLRTIIEPLGQAKDRLKMLYDFDLMLDSGHLTGYLVDDPILEAGVIEALEGLADPGVFAQKYSVGDDQNVLLFAMGDGNHSLATAKAIWEKTKGDVGMDHPARYALVEIENVHDEAVQVEPIHRVLFNLKIDVFQALNDFYGDNYTYSSCNGVDEMTTLVDRASEATHTVGMVSMDGFGVLEFANPSSNLPMGTLQPFLDAFLENGGAESIDYVHGEEVIFNIAAQPGNLGFYLSGMDKSDLFKTVILDGATPRKTFSMGEAWQKRFYMECRLIN